MNITKIEFEAHCYSEGSWGAKPLGKRKCSVELTDKGNGRAYIEFIAGDDVEYIGLSYNKNKEIYDFEGVFSIPYKAIELLNENGFNTEQVE